MLFLFCDVTPTPQIFMVGELGESTPSLLHGAATFCFLVLIIQLLTVHFL